MYTTGLRILFHRRVRVQSLRTARNRRPWKSAPFAGSLDKDRTGGILLTGRIGPKAPFVSVGHFTRPRLSSAVMHRIGAIRSRCRAMLHLPRLYTPMYE